jgi:hypothetical protein
MYVVKYYLQCLGQRYMLLLREKAINEAFIGFFVTTILYEIFALRRS